MGGTASAGPATDEDGHGATGHGRPQRGEGGDDTPRRESAERETADGEMEESPPPQTVTRAQRKRTTRGGKGEWEPPPSSARPRHAARERGETPKKTSERTPRKGDSRNQRGAPSELLERGIPTEDGGRQAPPPPNGSPRLTRAAEEGGEGEGNPPPSSAHLRSAAGARGGAPEQTTSGPPRQTGTRKRTGTSRLSRACKTRAGMRGWGTTRARPRHAGRARAKGGTPLYRSMHYQRMSCPSGRRGAPGDRRTRKGHPPSSVRSQRTPYRGEGGTQTP